MVTDQDAEMHSSAESAVSSASSSLRRSQERHAEFQRGLKCAQDTFQAGFVGKSQSCMDTFQAAQQHATEAGGGGGLIRTPERVLSPAAKAAADATTAAAAELASVIVLSQQPSPLKPLADEGAAIAAAILAAADDIQLDMTHGCVSRSSVMRADEM